MKHLKNALIIKKGFIFLGFICLIWSFSCVTVNVNFPEGAVQQATEDYVKELYKLKAEEKNTIPDKQTVDPLKKDQGALNFVFSFGILAHASPQFKIDSPEAKQIQVRQAKRLDKIDKDKKNGFLGESAQGLLVLRQSEKIKPLLMKKIDQLIKEENSDREALYRQVLKDNNLTSEQLVMIRQNFSKSFQESSPTGTWIESDGKWKQKK